MLTIDKLKYLIWNSKKLTKDQKFNAIEDLEFMESSKLYAHMVDYDKKLLNYNSTYDMFIFERSILGYDFWSNITYILSDEIFRINN